MSEDTTNAPEEGLGQEPTAPEQEVTAAAEPSENMITEEGSAPAEQLNKLPTGNEGKKLNLPTDYDTAEFEPMPNIQRENPFTPPVIEREIMAPNGGASFSPPPEDGTMPSAEGMDDFVMDDSDIQSAGEEVSETPPAAEDEVPGAPKSLNETAPDTTKKAKRATAKNISKTYQKVLPIIPKKVATPNMPKYLGMHQRGEIDLGTEVSDGQRDTTIMGVLKQFESVVESDLSISDEQRKEFEDALYDYLLEHDMELTPGQRLALVVGSHVVQLGSVAFSIKTQTNSLIKQLKQANSAQGRASSPIDDEESNNTTKSEDNDGDN